MARRGSLQGFASRVRHALRVLRGPGVLMAWQFAPVQVVPDSTGTLRVALAYGTGSYEHFVPGCNGPDAYIPVDIQSVGASVDYWVSDNIRASAVGGTLRAETTADGGDQGEGGYKVGLVAYEGDRFGVGLGVVSLNDPTADPGSISVPMGYFRLGDLGGVHARAELIGYGPAIGTTGFGRFGAAYNQGRLVGPRWFIGWGADRIYGWDSAAGATAGGPFIDFWFPIGRRFEVGAGANRHFSQEHPDHALWFGGAFSVGGGPGG